MKRLAVVVLYNKDGCLEEYEKYLLNSLKIDFEEIVVVFNGVMLDSARKIVLRYCQKFYERENVGFDCGAYKDLFTRLLPEGYLEEFEEIVLMNNTFFGPFVPWSHYLEEMEKGGVDFWGLNDNKENAKYPWHIDSYLLAVRKTMFTSGAWSVFWENIQSPRSYEEDVRNFELNFSCYFRNKGFRSTVWVQEFPGYKNLLDIENATFNDPYLLLRDFDFPLLRKKVLTSFFAKDAADIISHIRNNTNYPVRFVEDLIGNCIYDGQAFDLVELERFYNNHRYIYIYGYGVFAKQVAGYFKYKNWQFAGFVVSKKCDDEPTMEFSQLEIKETDGIILAVTQMKAYSEIYAMLIDVIQPQNLLLPMI